MLSVHDEKVHFSVDKHLLRLILAQISPAYDQALLAGQGLVKIKEPDRQADKILKVIEYALSKEVDFLLLPELTAPFHHLERFESALKGSKGDLVANICYEHAHLEDLMPILSEEELTRHELALQEDKSKLVNFCRIAVKAGVDFRVFTQIKLSPFSGEFSLSARDTLFCGKIVYRFLTNWGNFLVLICKDYVGEVKRRGSRTPMFDFLKSLTDQGLHWVFVSALNTEPDAFIHAARAFYYLQERSSHTFTLFLNTAELDNTAVVFPARPHPKIRTTRDVQISPLFEGKPGWGTRLTFPGCGERLIGGTFVRLDRYQPMPTKEILSPVFQTELLGLSALGIAEELLITPESVTEKRVMPRTPHNLPPQSTSFVGREEELAEIVELLRSSSCTLLTLLGPGGIGKTRLALQAAVETMSEFAQGVYFVPLAALSSQSFLVSTVAQSLGFSFRGPEDPKRQLLNYLREKDILLVLDNFEHLLDAGALLTEILKTAPHTKMLVTSRERLNLKGEVIVQVRGMDFPTTDEVGDVSHYSAVLLFLQNAERVRPGFSLSDEDRKSVVRICQMVEGMPLGIELASSWLRALSCKEVAKEVENNLDFLASSARNVPERHRSMRAVFEYSWDLLSEEEKKGFMKMSVFRGGFRRDAAQRVTGASLLLLSALVDKSLVRWNPSERYEIHELLRQYAEEKLSEFPQERQTVQELHCLHFLELLRQDGKSVKAKGQEEVVQRVRSEIENIRRAWSWAIENCKEDLIEASLENLFHFYILQSWFKEGEGLFGRAVEKLNETTGEVNAMPVRSKQVLGRLLARHGVFWAALSGYARARELLKRGLDLLGGYDLPKERAFCLRNLGLVLTRLGKRGEAGEFLREGLEICRRIEDSDGTAATLNSMGHCSYLMGDYEEARRLYAQSLPIYREIGNSQGVAKTLLNLGNVAQDKGEYEEAKVLYEESLAMSREIGDQSGTASSLNNLGLVAYQLGEYERAKQLYERSLTLKREIGDRRGITMSLGNLGNVAQKLGRYPEAEQFYQEMLALSKEIGSKRGVSAALTCMGHATSALGQFKRAGKYFHDALETAVEIDAIPMALDALAGIAALLAEAEEKERALQLLALVSADARAWQDTKDRVSRLITDLASQLPPKVASDAQEAGRTEKLADVARDLLKHRHSRRFT